MNKKQLTQQAEAVNARHRNNVTERRYLHPSIIGAVIGVLIMTIAMLFFPEDANAAFILLPLPFTIIASMIYVVYQRQELRRDWDFTFTEQQEKMLEQYKIGRDNVVTRRHALLSCGVSILFALITYWLCA